MIAQLEGSVLKWARKRAGLSREDLAEKLKVPFETVDDWEINGKIAFGQAQALAESTYTPFGFLFLAEPPEEKLPVSDFRRTHEGGSDRPSANLLEVLYSAQRKQEWYREYALQNQIEPVSFVGALTPKVPPVEAAAAIRSTLHLDKAFSERTKSWEDALRGVIEIVENSGILVLRAGYAAGSTHRSLAVDEFRGFALADRHAPLIFINGADALAAQLFTLAHELVHIWLGESGVSNLEGTYAEHNIVEKYCNEVAAELLVPSDQLRKLWRKSEPPIREVERLSRTFKVSRVVIARRARDAGFISPATYRSFFSRETAAVQKGNGGQYYQVQQSQNSRRFSTALIMETREGRTLHHDAMKLLGIKKDETFRKFAHSLNLDL